MNASRTPIRFHHTQDEEPCRCLDCQRLEEAIRRAVSTRPPLSSVAV